MSLDRNRLPDPESYFDAQGLALQRGGKWRTTRCEFHGGSDSMRVNLETGAFVCMAQCGARGGDVVAYEMASRGVGFVEACRALGAWQDDPHDQHHIRHRPLPFPARDALEVLRDEAQLAAVAAGNVAQGVELTEEDKGRLLEAAGRIRFIADAIV